MKLTPAALFVYRRPEHTRRVMQALAGNAEASATPLVVFSDAPREAAAAADVEAVRAIIAAATGFASITLVKRERNYGLSRSIISGIGDVLRRYESVIVLEDDLLPSMHFLSYMNQALSRYRNDSHVVSVHGYCYPVAGTLPDTFFLRGADCWGWGTWRRGWAVYQPDGATLLAELQARKLTRQFDLDGGYPYTQMLRDSVAGRNDSWAVKWHASAFLKGLLTLYPGRSQIQNIGVDGSGRHVAATDVFTHRHFGSPVAVQDIAIEECERARRAFAAFLRSTQASFTARLRRRLADMLVQRSPQ
jgi:hypothetical protein